jgi:hypothetical protein
MENKEAKQMAAMLMSKLDDLDLDKVKGIQIGIMFNKEKDFKPHKMYDEEGEAHDADTYEDHIKMKKMGYKHKEEMEDDA